MEIIRLPIGKQAPVDVDCIRIEEQPGGNYKLTASALCSQDNDDESVSVIDTQLFATAQEAEATGVAWAEDIGVSRLFVGTGTLDHPLELLEIDRPL
ncbi:hypothetical protein [Novosphingobium sp. 9U]|uniref:hypothetical protein n=1 Tax=Novosphingobium sp. 9U TaxID=2653158 RepID=UPI0012F39D65|nr:hypothetical protein [Novosphingobium sp. 9U]VWX55158.1 conserved hypothetical protein [Novosphingobium sp. 9U]